jgi:hypothetical protein
LSAFFVLIVGAIGVANSVFGAWVVGGADVGEPIGLLAEVSFAITAEGVKLSKVWVKWVKMSPPAGQCEFSSGTLQVVGVESLIRL